MPGEWDVVSQTPAQAGGWDVVSHTPVEKPGFLDTFQQWVDPRNSVPALYHALTDRSEFAAMARDPQFAQDLSDATKRKSFIGPPAPGQTMYGHKADSAPPEDVPSYGQIAGGIAGQAVNAALLAAVLPGMKAVGRGLKAAAVPVAESALGVKAIQRAYGKTPGQFALEETSGIRPGAVADSARKRIGLLNTELENRAAASTTPASLQPAIDVIDKRSATAAAGNSSYTPDELARMRAHLTEPQPGFTGSTAAINQPPPGTAGPSGPVQITPDQSPSTILRMKREFGKDFTKYNPLHPAGEMGTARAAYGALDGELDRTVPGADELNQRISSGIPVAERGEQQDLNAGATQRVMHRVAAHSGALLGAGAGYAAGGIPGAAAGLILPEVLSSPTTRMAGARALHGAGKAIGSTAAQRAAQAALILQLQSGLLDTPQRRRGLLDQ